MSNSKGIVPRDANGIPALAVYDPVTGMVVPLQGVSVQFDSTGQSYAVLDAAPPITTSSVLSSVAANASAATLLAANTARKGFSITNDGAANLFIAFGQNPTTSSYKYRLTPYACLIEPSGSPLWTGSVVGIWDTANGSARISEES